MTTSKIKQILKKQFNVTSGISGKSKTDLIQLLYDKINAKNAQNQQNVKNIKNEQNIQNVQTEKNDKNNSDSSQDSDLEIMDKSKIAIIKKNRNQRLNRNDKQPPRKKQKLC